MTGSASYRITSRKQLFDHSQARLAMRCVNFTSALRRREFGFLPLERQSLPVLLGENADYRHHRYHDLMRHAAESPTATDDIVTQMQIAHCLRTQVENDFPILDIGHRHTGLP